jgi:hypothetical protein
MAASSQFQCCYAAPRSLTAVLPAALVLFPERRKKRQRALALTEKYVYCIPHRALRICHAHGVVDYEVASSLKLNKRYKIEFVL